MPTQLSGSGLNDDRRPTTDSDKGGSTSPHRSEPTGVKPKLGDSAASSSDSPKPRKGTGESSAPPPADSKEEARSRQTLMAIALEISRAAEVTTQEETLGSTRNFECRLPPVMEQALGVVNRVAEDQGPVVVTQERGKEYSCTSWFCQRFIDKYVEAKQKEPDKAVLQSAEAKHRQNAKEAAQAIESLRAEVCKLIKTNQDRVQLADKTAVIKEAVIEAIKSTVEDSPMYRVLRSLGLL
eukprot:m51a1_g3915 hypothetical protein (239) ;mRNA; r:160842-161758